ncbi:hypothetical protein [Actinomadura sp. HBU206391]|uniref:hypothetical protein n=1 Tax=Actinomadura sp. HBU206391 TaxID=2731692 RepID=UPI00164FBDE0|nr:hypothetical protein [Actinomadura sp. HBU206391]MBC6462387.1 hypothetical protein [Actinomadura sp. HBU206391]
MSRATEEELMAEVRAAFAALEPLPEGVLAAGRATLAWRMPDATLAELVTDSLSGAPGVRGTSRLLTFGGADLEVEVEVSGAGRDLELVGRLSPPAPAQVRVRHLSGELTARVDRTGHFIVSGVPSGLLSLVFRLPDAGSIVTSWVRV